MSALRIAALEPYAALSHSLFLEGLRESSRHRIELLCLPARAWKWRMRTAALHYARELPKTGPWDLLFVSDYVNLAELRALLPPELRDVPAIVYFHENQLTYPLQGDEQRDHQFALIHLYAILAARAALFNSRYHRTSFLEALPALLEHAPDVDVAPALAEVRACSSVLPLGTDVPAGEPRTSTGGAPVILWNHRWEYDKDPDAFLEALLELARRGVDFRVRVLGQSFRDVPSAFARMQSELGSRLETIGFVPDRAAYLDAVRGAQIVVSTARHEFFGLGTLEAIRCGLYPVLPDDLAYPELLPENASAFLYRHEDGAAGAIERALDAVASEASMPERKELVRSTDRFTWSELAPRFDAAFDAAAG